MFLRQQHKRVVLLQGYRDGRNRVLHRRLAHLEPDQLERLSDESWRREFEERYPEITPDWERLARQAQGLRRAEAARKPVDGLLKRIEREHDVEVLTQLIAAAEERLEALQSEAASGRAARRRYAENDPEVSELREQHRRWDEELRDRPEERCQRWAEWVELCPTAEGRLELGLRLHRLGRLEEAAEQYEQLPRSWAVRYFQLASVAFDQDRPEQCLAHLLDGLKRDRTPGITLEGRGSCPYWQRCGDTWSDAGKTFFRRGYMQFAVRWPLTQAQQAGVKPRRLLSSMAFARALRVALGLEEAAGRPQPSLAQSDTVSGSRAGGRPRETRSR